jgi:hypothetical protein
MVSNRLATKRCLGPLDRAKREWRTSEAFTANEAKYLTVDHFGRHTVDETNVNQVGKTKHV